ncbi:hypothetical protein IAR55_004634 [Kwoniella newhampshirensis]|uniref:Aminotransferase class V domain-containing protein n=1 Tax=Kwoniella newhampshirensis TaxID=1651941 RepID=A0AAW0YK40_9TREE
MSTKSDTIVPSKEQRFDFFFYGTLCVPAVLTRVLGHKCEGLTFQDALLPNYTRHRVKGETYPAIVDKDTTNRLLSKSDVLTSEEVNTRGTLVRGLTYADVNALDLFEGTEYSRTCLPVQALTSPSTINRLPEALANPTSRVRLDNLEAEKAVKSAQGTDVGVITPGTAVAKFVDAVDNEQDSSVEGGVDVGMTNAWTYIWSDPIERLEPGIWRFEEFIEAKASLWNHLPSDWFSDVDRQRVLQEELAVAESRTQTSPSSASDADGDESTVEGKVVEGFPDFGHDMLKYWGFRDGYVNMNHGSYGSAPKPVTEYMHKMSEEIEGNPDFFMRRTWAGLLDKVREEAADLIGAQTEEVVVVPNTTHGINNILTNLDWADGDIIVNYSTTYGAVAQTLKYLADRHPNIRLETIDIHFPTSHASIVQATEDLFEKYNEVAIPNYTGQSKPNGKKPNERVRLVVVDAIASMPGVIYPWERIVGVCKKYGVISLVDAAHAIGQVEVDVKKADCDYWVANCHKWLLSHRGGAVMYVPTRNQHLIRTTFPTSAGYESSRYPTEGGRPWSWIPQYQWNGTIDWTPFFSITKAFEFRRSIGGEERIRKYNHSLAVEGGKRVAKLWGTQIMENPDGELTAAMVNVEMPHISVPDDLADAALQEIYIQDGLFQANCYAAPYRHNGKWWTRFSTQVWNDLSDFEYIAKALDKICLDVKAGKYKKQDLDGNELKVAAQGLPTTEDQ